MHKKKCALSGGRTFKQPNQLINKLITKSIKLFHSKFHSNHYTNITMFNYYTIMFKQNLLLKFTGQVILTPLNVSLSPLVVLVFFLI